MSIFLIKWSSKSNLGNSGYTQHRRNTKEEAIKVAERLNVESPNFWHYIQEQDENKPGEIVREYQRYRDGSWSE